MAGYASAADTHRTGTGRKRHGSRTGGSWPRVRKVWQNTNGKLRSEANRGVQAAVASSRQVEGNRRNASKSTGPVTEAGKERSRRNAIRHGLTAETVIGDLEDEEDYKRFEAAITADFNPETAVERELVLRLASALWRLRRATLIETGMFLNSNIIADQDQAAEHVPQMPTAAVVPIGSPSNLNGSFKDRAQCLRSNDDADRMEKPSEADTDAVSDLARRFLRLAAADNGAFVRLGRYETALWRQVCQTIFLLEALRRHNLDLKWLPRSSHPVRTNPFSVPAFAKR